MSKQHAGLAKALQVEGASMHVQRLVTTATESIQNWVRAWVIEMWVSMSLRPGGWNIQ